MCAYRLLHQYYDCTPLIGECLPLHMPHTLKHSSGFTQRISEWSDISSWMTSNSSLLFPDASARQQVPEQLSAPSRRPHRAQVSTAWQVGSEQRKCAALVTVDERYFTKICFNCNNPITWEVDLISSPLCYLDSSHIYEP